MSKKTCKDVKENGLVAWLHEKKICRKVHFHPAFPYCKNTSGQTSILCLCVYFKFTVLLPDILPLQTKVTTIIIYFLPNWYLPISCGMCVKQILSYINIYYNIPVLDKQAGAALVAYIFLRLNYI